MVLNTEIWYIQRVGISSHRLIKEKLMHERRAPHLPNTNSPALFYIGVEYPGQAKALEHHGTDITELGGQQ